MFEHRYHIDAEILEAYRGIDDYMACDFSWTTPTIWRLTRIGYPYTATYEETFNGYAITVRIDISDEDYAWFCLGGQLEPRTTIYA